MRQRTYERVYAEAVASYWESPSRERWIPVEMLYQQHLRRIALERLLGWCLVGVGEVLLLCLLLLEVT